MLKNDELGLQAYREIKKMILNGNLAPGDKIVQEKLAAKMGISRTPLRVALQMLEAENLIEPKSKSGYQVRIMEDSEILEIFDCRIALESVAAWLLAKNLTSKSRQKLRGFQAAFLEESKGAKKKYKNTDTQFHNYIVENCGNAYLWKLFQQGNLITYIERIGLIRPPELTLQDHLEIIEGILANDPVAAEHSMKAHLMHSRKVIEKKIKNKEKLINA